MDPSIQTKFKPNEATAASRDFSSAAVRTAEKAKDSTDPDKTSFKDLLLNSNDDAGRAREAQKNGDQLRMAKTDEEFAKMMLDKANAGNQRKPQNELDKDAFLKLFVTQMRNQDPLNPDNSAEMASQLAQFHGLEQMMNVNKNLEKMQSEESLGRAVTLLNFVGKDIKLDNGKLMVEGGKLATDATVKLDLDAPKATLEVRDSAGHVVASEDLGHVKAGEHVIDWDGKDKAGKRVGDGAYTFAVIASDERGQTVQAKITSTVQVTGVDLHDAGGSFYTAVGKVRVNEVASVGDVGFGKNAKKADGKAPAAGGQPPGDGQGGAPNAAGPAGSGAGGNAAGDGTGGQAANGAPNAEGGNAAPGGAPHGPLGVAGSPGNPEAAAAQAAADNAAAHAAAESAAKAQAESSRSASALPHAIIPPAAPGVIEVPMAPRGT